MNIKRTLIIKHTIIKLIITLGLPALLLSNIAYATAVFNTQAALFITFDSVSGGVSGTDYSVSADQPFTPLSSTTGSGNAATSDDVFPGGTPGWDTGFTYRVDVGASGDATLPGGTADASVLGIFDVRAENFSQSLSSITFNFSYNYVLTGSVTPGDPDEYARSFGNLQLKQGLVDLIYADLDLSTASGPLSDTLSNTGNFSIVVNQFEQKIVTGQVNAQGKAIAPHQVPLPGTIILFISGLLLKLFFASKDSVISPV